jgi:hypothetical protein
MHPMFVKLFLQNNDVEQLLRHLVVRSQIDKLKLQPQLRDIACSPFADIADASLDSEYLR